MIRKILLAMCVVLLSAPVFAAKAKVKVAATPQSDRQYWVDMLCKISYPVIYNLANETLHKNMPVEMVTDTHGDRTPMADLEAFGRTVCGLAPWLELPADNTAEGVKRAEMLALTLRAIKNAVDSSSVDHIKFTSASQALVDAAHLAQGLMRAPNNIWAALDPITQQRVIEHMKSTRRYRPNQSNWLMFSAMIEAFFHSVGVEHDQMRIDYPVREHQNWYKGDGVYGDGKPFHWDYYNSYVIQPMLIQVVGEMSKSFPGLYETTLKRAVRYAEIYERLISPEGTIPAVGRSLQYRTASMQVLSMMALMGTLPKSVSNGQVRAAMTALIHRFMDQPNTFDENGWLRIGFCGSQRDVAEGYACTGSLYLCTAGFVALGLPATAEFWTAPAEKWTSQKAWSGEMFPRDHSLE